MSFSSAGDPVVARQILYDPYILIARVLEESSERGALGLPHFQGEQAAGQEPIWRFLYDATDAVEAVVSREECAGIFVIADVRGESLPRTIFHVGRIGDDHVEGARVFGHGRKEIAFDEVERYAMTGGVGSGGLHGQGIEIAGPPFAALSVFRNAENNAAGACAEVEHATFRAAKMFEGNFDEVLGFGPGHEERRYNLEFE